MNINQMVNTRLITQQITGTKFKTAAAIVNWMGAMQAQDYAMSKWAIGVSHLQKPPVYVALKKVLHHGLYNL